MFSADVLAGLLDPAGYVGAAGELVDRALQQPGGPSEKL